MTLLNLRHEFINLMDTGHTNNRKKDIVQYTVLFLIVVVAWSLRLWNVDFAAPWQDEVHSIVYSRTPAADLLNIGRVSDIHPPLYFLSLKTWFSFFEETRLSARMFSVFFGTLCVPMVFLIARRLYGVKVALLAAAFFATAPLAIHYAREVRMYPFYTFLFLVSFYGFLRFVDSIRSDSASWTPVLLSGSVFAIFLSMTFYTHYTSVLLFICYSLVSLYFLAVREFKVFAFLVGALFVATLLTIPQVYHLLNSSLSDPRKDWMQPTTLSLFYGTTMGAYPFHFIVKPVIFLSLAAGWIAIWFNSKLKAIILGVFTAGGTIIAAVIGVVEPIYLIRTIQVFTVFSSIVLAFFATRIHQRPLAACFILFVLGVNLSTSLSRSYLPEKEYLFAEKVIPLASYIDPQKDIVIYKKYYGTQVELTRSGLFRGGEFIELVASPEERQGVTTAVQNCLEASTGRRVEIGMNTVTVPAACRSALLVVEEEARFEKEASKQWNEVVNDLLEAYPNYVDGVVEGVRVSVFSTDTEHLRSVAEALQNAEDYGE